jgi:hypothetical protein
MWALKAFRKVPSTRNYFEHDFYCLVPFFFFCKLDIPCYLWLMRSVVHVPVYIASRGKLCIGV